MSSPLRLAFFGDSLAAGVGVQDAADTLGPLLVAHLADVGVRAEHRVFALSGARSAALPGQVSGAGAWPQVAVVVVGANDVTHAVPVEEAVADLRTALGALRSAGTEVVLVPAPDLSIVAHVPPALRDLARRVSTSLRAAQERVAEDLGVWTVDTSAAAAAFAGDAQMFSGDLFHPSAAGYRLVAEAVAPVVGAAARAALARA